MKLIEAKNEKTVQYKFQLLDKVRDKHTFAWKHSCNVFVCLY